MKRQYVLKAASIVSLLTVLCLQLPAQAVIFKIGDEEPFTGTLDDFYQQGGSDSLLEALGCCVLVNGENVLDPPDQPELPPPDPDAEPPQLPFPPLVGPGILEIEADSFEVIFQIGIPINPESPFDLSLGVGAVVTYGFSFSPLATGISGVNLETTTIVDGEIEVLDFLFDGYGAIINLQTGEGLFGEKAFLTEEGSKLNGKSFSVSNVSQEAIHHEIPEPSFKIGLLFFTTLSLSLVLKRQPKRS